MASTSKSKESVSPLHESSNKAKEACSKNPSLSQQPKNGEPFNPVFPEGTYHPLSSHLTRQDLLRRRLLRVKQLSRLYKDHFWAFTDELRVMFKDYYWKYGVSPCKDEEERDGGDREVANTNVEGSGETNANNMNSNLDNWGVVGKIGSGFGEGGVESKVGGNNRCVFVGCKLKAMALTSFCLLHILSDQQQQLYKACNYVIKSAPAGSIICGKPILRSTVPALCNVHFLKTQKHVTVALKKAGLNVSCASKLAPMFHLIVAEYVCQIQSNRRAIQRYKLLPRERLQVKSSLASCG